MTNPTNNQIIEVVALALRNRNDGRFLLARRGPTVKGAGEWEFPGGKIEPDETPEEALIREIQEELAFDLRLYALQPVAENTHTYPGRTVRILLLLAETDHKPAFQLSDHDAVMWCTANQMLEVNLSEGDKFFISFLNSYSR